MSHRRSKGVSFRQRPQTRTPVGLQLLLLSLPQFSGRHLHLSFPHYPSDISACMFNIASWKKSLIEATFSFFPFFYFPSPWQSQSSSWKNPVKFVPYSTDKLLTDFPLWLHKPINKPQTYIVTKIHLKGQWWKCCAVLCLHTSRERERETVDPQSSLLSSSFTGFGFAGKQTDLFSVTDGFCPKPPQAFFRRRGDRVWMTVYLPQLYE